MHDQAALKLAERAWMLDELSAMRIFASRLSEVRSLRRLIVVSFLLVASTRSSIYAQVAPTAVSTDAAAESSAETACLNSARSAAIENNDHLLNLFPDPAQWRSVRLQVAQCVDDAGFPSRALDIALAILQQQNGSALDLESDNEPRRPREGEIEYVIARADEKLGRFVDAAKAIDKVYSRGPNDTLEADKERMLAEAQQSAAAEETLLPPRQRCAAIVIRRAYESIGSNPITDSDGSVERSMNEPEYQFDIAKCLQEHRNYVEARDVLLRIARAGDNPSVLESRDAVLERLADVEEKLGLHELAVKHIRQAYASANRYWSADPDQRMGFVNDDLDKDYERINAQQNRAEAMQTLHQNQASWDNLTVDERRIVSGHGGTRDNYAGYPCHYETYDSSGYHEEIWWYGGCESGDYSSAYRFVNGVLQSIYNP